MKWLMIVAAGISFLSTPTLSVAGDVPPDTKCPPVDQMRFWLPDDMDFAMSDFLAKATTINNSGTCVIDGWFGRNENKFYMTVVPPGYSKIGKVKSFTLGELRKDK